MQHKLNPEQGKLGNVLAFGSLSALLYMTSLSIFVNLPICPLFNSIVPVFQVWGLPNLRWKLQEQHGEWRKGAGPWI